MNIQTVELSKVFNSSLFVPLALEMVEVVRLFHERSWSQSTSTNCSFLMPNNLVCLSRSGVDKSKFVKEDFLIFNLDRLLLYPEGANPSAEAGIHFMLYQKLGVKAVLHSHSVLSTVFSHLYLSQKKISWNGFEMQKAIKGIKTHESTLSIPIFENSQDIDGLAEKISVYLENNKNVPGFFLAGHGLYAWGDSIACAKRHIEAIEFLLDCLRLEKSLN